MDDCCGQRCASILKLPIKLVLFLLFLAVMLLIFVSRDLMVLIGVTSITLIAGMFGFSLALVKDQEGFMCLLAVLFFPVTMIFGIILAFKEIFCDVAPNMCSDYCKMFCSGAGEIC